MLDFVNNPYKGAEMLPYERFKMFSWVSYYKPAVVLEIGTGNGGGTSYIAEAVKMTGFKCRIITCDPKRKPVPEFFEEYPFVEYYNSRSDIVIQDVIDRGLPLDFIFFDGPEDPEVALRDIKELEKYITSGTLFCMHDWEYTQRYYDGAVSTKALLIRPYIEESDNWEKVEVLDGLRRVKDSINESVGLCLYKYIR